MLKYVHGNKTQSEVPVSSDTSSRICCVSEAAPWHDSNAGNSDALLYLRKLPACCTSDTSISSLLHAYLTLQIPCKSGTCYAQKCTEPYHRNMFKDVRILQVSTSSSLQQPLQEETENISAVLAQPPEHEFYACDILVKGSLVVGSNQPDAGCQSGKHAGCVADRYTSKATASNAYRKCCRT